MKVALFGIKNVIFSLLSTSLNFVSSVSRVVWPSSYCSDPYN